jgi:hypothetical protein
MDQFSFQNKYISKLLPHLYFLHSQLHSNWTAFVSTHFLKPTCWIQNLKLRCWFKNGCCSSWNMGTDWVSVSVKVIIFGSILRSLLFVGINSEIEIEGVCRGEGNKSEMWHMWLGWRRLISNNIYNLTCTVINCVGCAWEVLHFVQIVYLTVTVQFKQFI